MINLHESMGLGRDRTRDPWICSQTRICCQTRYRLRYAARCVDVLVGGLWLCIIGPKCDKKSVFRLSNKARLKPISSATETSQLIEILLITCLYMILSKKRTTKALIRLPRLTVVIPLQQFRYRHLFQC